MGQKVKNMLQFWWLLKHIFFAIVTDVVTLDNVSIMIVRGSMLLYVTQSEKMYLLAQSNLKKILVCEQLLFCCFMIKLNNI